MPPVAIAILVHGGQEWIERFLPTVLQTDYPNFTVWVIDNASAPSLAEWVKARFPQVSVVRYEENLGYAGGYQRFFTEEGHKYPYLVLLNSDVEVPPGWLRPLIAALEAYPTLAAVQPKVRAWHDRSAFEYAGAAGGFWNPWGYPTCRGRSEKDHGQYDRPSRIFWATGAALTLRTAAIRQSLADHLLKPHFFMHMEEIDLCWRLQRAGWQIGYIPESIVYHVGGASLAQQSPTKTYLNFRNSLLLLWENLSGAERYLRVLWRLVLDAVAGLYLLWRGGPAHLQAVVRAHWDFFRQARRPSDFLPKKPLRQLDGVLHWPFSGLLGQYPHLPLPPATSSAAKAPDSQTPPHTIPR